MTWETGWTLRALAPNKKSAFGLALIVLGIAAILWAVFHVLNALPSPGPDFAHRNTDYQDRAVVHEHYVGLAWRGLVGVALLLLGSRVRRKAG